jgi:hypothetical protein
MRALVVVVVLGLAAAPVAADAKRECHLHDPAVTVKDLGCFDDLRNTGDHTYGSRLCLVRAGTVCSGVLWLWNGDLEGQATVLEDATCGAKSGAVSFFGTHDEGATIHLINFTGRLAKRVLRGAYSYGKTKKRTVAWKQTPKAEAFDAANRIRDLTAAVCRPVQP